MNITEAQQLYEDISVFLSNHIASSDYDVISMQDQKLREFFDLD